MPDKSTLKGKIKKELISPEGNKNVGFDVFTILDEILADKQTLGLPAKWTYYYRLGRNKHWKNKSKKVALKEANLLNTHRQKTVNSLTDNNPTFNIKRIGAEEGKEGVYDTLLHIAQHWWHDQEQQKVLRKSVLGGETNGCCIEKMVFNPDLEGGLGDAETIVVDPFHFGCYPVKFLDNQKTDANLHYRSMSIREARRKWPKHADKIKSDKEWTQDMGDSRREIQAGSTGGQGGVSWHTKIGNVVKHMLGNFVDQEGGPGDEVLIVEAWVKDYTRELDDKNQGFEKYTGNIRRITCCNGGELVLEDKDNPSINPTLELELARKTYLFDKFPFSLTQSVTDNVSPWGSSDFEQLEGLQLEINKTLSQYNLFKDKVSRLKIINPKDSGVKNSQLDNYPGVISPANRLVAAGLRYLDPPKNPIDLIQALGIYKDLFFLVAGDFEMDRAKEPGRSVIAYKAIAALLEKEATMKKDKEGNYSSMIRIRGRMYISMVQNWYTEEREVPYEEDGEELVEKVNGWDLIVPAKLTVISGSTMPISRVQEREEAIELFKLQAIPLEELLKKLDWPEWKKVGRSMREGPFSAILQMLDQIGAPPQFLQFLQQLFQTDPKEFEKALKAEQVPPFETLVQPQGQLGEGQDPAQEAELAEQQASTELKMAQAEKVDADIALIEEKILSERILQLVKASGISLDASKLKIERARLVTEMEIAKEAALMIGKELAKSVEKGSETVRLCDVHLVQSFLDEL